MRSGAKSASASKNSLLLPLLGGSINTTSTRGRSEEAARRRIYSPASSFTKVMFLHSFLLAFAMASFTADGFSSTPITLPAYAAALMPIVPMPQ